MLRAKNFAYLQEPLYYYYQHDASTVHTITKKRCEDRMEAARIMVKEAREFGFFEKYYAELESSFTTLFYVNTLFSYMAGSVWFCKSAWEGNEGYVSCFSEKLLLRKKSSCGGT